jgi:alanine dehydrogenase
MIIGVPKEIKTAENRVGMVPVGVEMLTKHGHKVYVEKNAGVGSSFSDDMYVEAGAEILDTADQVWDVAEMIIKVKEPLAEEYPRIKKDQVVFTYFHFAADEALTRGVLERECVAIAYETIEDTRGALPLLIPMSEVAGRMSVQEGAKYLEHHGGGRGLLLGGVPGVNPGEVCIIGGGVVGTNAAMMAAGLGARVTILDVNLDRLRYLAEVMPANVTTLHSNPANIRACLEKADLLVGAVLIPGGKAPHLVTRDMLKLMKTRAVIVDVAVDQGGCIETIKPTTHTDPVYYVDDVLHYAVANMPGAVPHTSTLALTNATMPFAIKLANEGYEAMAKADPGFAKGINMINGKITYKAVAEAFDMDYTPLEDVM